MVKIDDYWHKDEFNIHIKDPDMLVKPGSRIVDREGTTYGITTGDWHSCRMEGCNGLRLTVKWQDGKTTFPCSAGLKKIGPNIWKII